MTDPLSEARWTPSRPDCPHPERWHSVDDESSELEVSIFLAGLAALLQPDLVVEVGAAFGQTSEQVGEALRGNGHGRLIALELDAERAAAARDRCAGLPVEVLEVDAASFIPPGPVALAFIDGHIDRRVADAERLAPFLGDGAIVVFHDAGPQHGIRAAVEALPWLRFTYFRTPRGLLVGERLTPGFQSGG